MAGAFFDKATVLAGLYTAMDFGSPNDAADKATFYMPRSVSLPDANRDQEHVPFNPAINRTFGALVKKTVRCAVEYEGKQGKDSNFGTLVPDVAKITLLDPEYQLMRGAEYVVVSGLKYLYWKREPTIALGSIDVHITYWRAEDVM